LTACTHFIYQYMSCLCYVIVTWFVKKIDGQINLCCDLTNQKSWIFTFRNACCFVSGWVRVRIVVFYATFNNISVIERQSGLLLEETGVSGENHRPVASSCIEYTSPWTGFDLTTLVVIGTDCIGSCKSNYHAITTRKMPCIRLFF
jgi:hypothetical protein